MTRAQLRRFLRSKLGDMHPTNPIFSDSDLNLALLMAGRLVQNWVNAVDPNPYCNTLIGDITINTTLYTLPGNYRSPGIRLLELLESGSWKEIGRQEFNDLDTDASRAASNSSNSTNDKKYAIGGKLLRLKYNPTATVSGGMRMTYSAHVNFTDDDDNSVLQLPIELDPCIYRLAAYELCPDIGADRVDVESHYTAAEKIFDKWAAGFKTTIGKDGEQINHVGGHVRTQWSRD